MTSKELRAYLQEHQDSTELDLSNKGITALPPEIGRLTKLQILDLSSNQLTSLPPEIERLTNLQALYLWGNQLTLLPPEIVRFINLQTLSLWDNQLTTLPTEIGRLINLQTLYLYKNQLTKLPPEIGLLTNLQELYLGSNQLRSLPPEIGRLTNLQKLYLGSNQLTTLPSEIGRLTNLQKLDLYGNQLMSLPPEIGNLEQLIKLDLIDNPLGFSPEILTKVEDPKAIIVWYQANVWSQEAKRPLNEAKVVLVGQGGVGKTSLVRRLVDNTFDPHEDMTRGIEIRRWKVASPGKEIKLNIWDFGGQEIMHATHQFFLTKRSLYLLVLDSRLDEQANRLEYWLKLIQAFGSDAPIVVVCNKCDQGHMALNWEGLKKKYPHIKAFVRRVSCKKGTGIKELHKVIAREVGKLEFVADTLAENWFAVKDQLAAMTADKKDYLSYDEYITMCRDKEISEDKHQRSLIDYLHDLGIALHFDEHPLFILNPEWVTQSVYQILNAHALFQNKGVLQMQKLKRILPAKRYPPERHRFIIDIMRKFELLFEIRDRNEYLVPDLLPKDEPYTGDWQDSLHFQFHYDVLPASVISRLMVNLHGLILQKTCWRTGVVLQSLDQKNKALIKADSEDNKTYIWVNGELSTRPVFLATIKTALHLIHQSIPGLKIEEFIPVPEQPDTLLNYKFIANLIMQGEDFYKAPGPDDNILIVNLTVIGDIYHIGQAGVAGRGAQVQGGEITQVGK